MASSEEPTGHHSERSPRRGGAIAVVALVMSLAALGLATWTVLRPTGTPTQSYSEGQRNDAKSRACAAADTVRKGVSLNTNLQSPGGEGDVTGSLAVAANARLALSNGGLYLIARLDPATPSEVADAVRTFANSLMDIGAAATAGIPNTDPAQAARLRDADTANAKVADLCK